MASVPPEPPNPYEAPQSTGPPTAAPTADERLWGMLCHLLALAGYAIPLGNVIGPLVIWLIKKDEMPFVDDQGKESLNFQISIVIYFLISIVLSIIIIGVFLAIAVAIFALVMIIIAAVKAQQGEYYRYPLTIRLIP